MSAEDEKLSLDAEDDSGTIILSSKPSGSGEAKEFSIDKKNALISILVKQALETDPSAERIPVPMVEAAILEKIVQYMNHWKGTEAAVIEKPLRQKELSAVTNSFDADFIDGIDNASRQDLYDIILAANYMGIEGLLHLGNAKVASLIKGQPLEKIKDILAKGTIHESKSEN